MGRRSSVGDQPTKAQRRKTAARKSRIAPKAERPRTTSTANLETEVARLTRERDEALEQQAAISDILEVISKSPSDVQPVLDSVAEHAARICEAHVVDIAIVDNEVFRIAASFGKLGRLSKGEAAPLDRSSVTGRSICDLQPVHIADMENAGDEFPLGREFATRFGHRTTLSVPLIREGCALGAILVRRTEVRPFEEKHIALLKAFANQAAIAIENVRLFKAEQQRSRELTESLEQQTATSEVLEVISRSPGDSAPVFSTMLTNAVRICNAKFGNIYRWDGDALHLVASHNTPTAYAQHRKRFPLRFNEMPESLGRMIATRVPTQTDDLLATTDDPRNPVLTAAVELGGIRTILNVPMVKENKLVGAIIVSRQEVRPFTQKQIELVKSFAAQAVIAIENARLLNELRQRTDDLTERTADLTEALEQQTATSDVLRVISSSGGELGPVFQAMLENAVRICDAKFGNIYRWDGEALHLLAAHNTPPAFAEARRRLPRRAATSFLRRMMATKTPDHVTDVAATKEYSEERLPGAVTAVELGGVRTFLAVPMLHENELIGSFSLYRQEVRPFTDKQIALVTSLAAQAVIAIENARLLNELRESLQQQTATADVLKVISRSTFDLQTVLNTLVESAARLCEADTVVIGRPKEKTFYFEATYGFSQEHAEFFVSHPAGIDRGTISGRVMLDRKIVHVFDILADPEYTYEAPKLGEFRTIVGVPLLREGSPIGVIALGRNSVRPFTDKQIELVTTFADQAVIAIENARLLSELRESLRRQTATADVLKVVSRSTFDLPTVLNTLTESAARLCAADMGILFQRDGDLFRLAANYGFSPEAKQYAVEHPIRLDRCTVTGRAALEDRVIHIPDVLVDPEFDHQRAFGYRTSLGVPLLREGSTIGVFVLVRDKVNPFTDKQIELVTTFADQAVIAIENTRLLNELRESLEQQTATSKVLEVISRSAFDLHAVFATVAESSVKLCGANRAFILRFDGELLRAAVAFNVSPDHKDFVERNPIRPNRHSAAGRAALERRTIHIPDIRADPEHTYRAKDVEAFRTILGVPILKGDELLGVIIIYHLEVRPFTDKQIALVETFADQAAIAIENVRLLDELRQRTSELGRSVEELRALGEISQAVNSTLELETVLSTIVANAVQLSGTEAGAIYVFDQQREFRLRATYGMDRELIDALTQQTVGMNEPYVAAVFAEREPLQVSDLQEGAPSPVNEIIVRAGFRAVLVAPLIRGEEIVGLLVVRRRTPGAFPQNIVDLIKTFAAQSAVAIENARLFKDVEASLEDLRTTQDRLVQTQKLASLGQLTAGIAHEIKNPLNFVNNFSGVSVELIDELQQALDSPQLDNKGRAEIAELANTLRGNLDKIVQHGKRADAIVKNMLLHSREGSGEHRLVDVNALVEESLNLAYHGARAEKPGFKINMEESFDPAAGKIDVFPQEITRALLNLISNGFYAATKRKEQDKTDGYEPTLVASTKDLGDRVEIRIRDNGTGISPEVREKLFSPFFTTKPAGEGTGLGLSISHDIIVRQHAGSIEVDTKPGEFTEFKIILPRVAVPAKSAGRA
jgi:two-component system, NtrC family, sensor kinase